MPPKTFSLANVEKILVDSEQEYRSSKGDECEQVLENLCDIIASDEQYKSKGKGTMQDLKKVSLELDGMYPNLIYLDPENSELVWQPQDHPA